MKKEFVKPEVKAQKIQFASIIATSDIEGGEGEDGMAKPSIWGVEE